MFLKAQNHIMALRNVKKASEAKYPIRRCSRSQNQKQWGCIVSRDASEDPRPHLWSSGELVKTKILAITATALQEVKNQKNQNIRGFIMFLKTQNHTVAQRKVKNHQQPNIQSAGAPEVKHRKNWEYIMFCDASENP